MHRRIIIGIPTASIATFAGTAMAESPLAGVDSKPLVSTNSWADVIAQLQEFRRSGVDPWSMGYNPLHTFKSTNTRESVFADFLKSRDQLAAFHGEDSGSAYLTRHGHLPSANEHMAQSATPACRAVTNPISSSIHRAAPPTTAVPFRRSP